MQINQNMKRGLCGLALLGCVIPGTATSAWAESTSAKPVSTPAAAPKPTQADVQSFFEGAEKQANKGKYQDALSPLRARFDGSRVDVDEAWRSHQRLE
jgi:hypothetical protein